MPSAQFGQASPSRTSAASMVPSGVKSRPATRSSTWLPGSSAPVTQRVPSDDAGVDEVPDLRCRLLPQRPGADVALDQRRVLAESVSSIGSTSVGLELALEPLLVDLAVTGHADGQRLAGAVGVLEHDEDVLERVAGRPGPVVARELLVEVVDQRLDGRGVGRLLDVRGRGVVVRHGGGRADRDGLDVGGVVAVRAADVGVLADLGLGEELLGLRAAHRAGRRLDDDVVEAEPVEDPDVRRAVGVVRRSRPASVMSKE